MRYCQKVLWACSASLFMATAADNAPAQSADPGLVNMEYNTAWRYRDPYARREFAITVANFGDSTFEGTRGKQFVCVYGREVSQLGGYTREYPALRLPFERLAAGEEVVLRGQYFEEIERGASPGRITYRAEIVYDASLASDENRLNDDVNLANNKAQPEETVEISLLPRIRK